MSLAPSLFLAILCGAAAAGCNRAPAPNPAAGKAPTVASLVPAATDLILGMGTGDHLVAVSNYDQPRRETQSLPRVGDYRTIDWEKLAELKPAVMIVQFRPDKMPAGLEDRAARYGIRLVNVRINRLDDIFTTMTQLGEAIGEGEKAKRAAGDLRRQLDSVRAAVAGRPPVRTYIARTDDPLQAVGADNYMDDLLKIAGGENVLPSGGESYPAIDREQLLTLKPDVVVNLLPGASPQSMEKAKQFWSAAPSVPATREGRVYYLTEDYLLWPGMNVGNVAERFAAKLHPEAATKPAAPATRAGIERRQRDTGVSPVRATWKSMNRRFQVAFTSASRTRVGNPCQVAGVFARGMGFQPMLATQPVAEPFYLNVFYSHIARTGGTPVSRSSVCVLRRLEAA